MKKKGFHYSDGLTNDLDNDLQLTFSQLSGGRGNEFSVRIGEVDNDLSYWVDSKNIKLNNVSENELFLFINKNIPDESKK